MRALLLGLSAILLSWAAPAAADCVTSAQASPDSAGRAVAMVFVNNQGPFRFVVDTGASRSVLSSELAEHLGLRIFGQSEVHSVTDVRLAPLAHVASLHFGPVALANTDLPVLDGPMLAGEQGMLGFDSMKGRRVEIDFVSHCVVIMDADAPPPDARWIRVQGRLRFGAMMVAPGELQGVRVHVLLDTGSDVSLCNTAFRNAISRVRASVVEYHGNRAFTAGRPVVLENAIWTPRLHVGTASMSNITSYVGDYHIFDLWGLHDEPTILIGMDVIASSGAIVIDYASNTIYFRRRPSRPW